MTGAHWTASISGHSLHQGLACSAPVSTQISNETELGVTNKSVAPQPELDMTGSRYFMRYTMQCFSHLHSDFLIPTCKRGPVSCQILQKQASKYQAIPWSEQGKTAVIVDIQKKNKKKKEGGSEEALLKDEQSLGKASRSEEPLAAWQPCPQHYSLIQRSLLLLPRGQFHLLSFKPGK